MLKGILLAVASMALLPMAAMAAENDGRRIKVKVTAASHVATATFLDNATTRALITRFPLTVPMMDRYSRELVYRFPEALPANETTTSGYEVGDIVYWTPRHSFVIMYAQNGERISNLQKIGRIDSGVEVFARTGDTNVTFELLKE
ncbi:cyclophilin-like fold protein [Pseudochrobactrum sp. B5]|uniref:cyclophilin-like fold protein n=1 Tax=Pseudochrobactrum sp. B5 TaxID=1289478 RepID=UPI000950D84C|nr:cyclophilin-like fold protein [Pseudochrobactrum sp. B5]